jgi:hypothetical protein
MSRPTSFRQAFTAAMVLLAASGANISAATLDPPPETLSQLVVPLHLVVYDPCRDDDVELKGTLSFRGATMVSQDGTTALQYGLQAAEVHGAGVKTGTRYDLVGDSQGVTGHLDRLVTEDDFRVIARQEPGVEVGRASVEPRYTATLEVKFSERGTIEAVVATAVVTNMKCL